MQSRFFKPLLSLLLLAILTTGLNAQTAKKTNTKKGKKGTTNTTNKSAYNNNTGISDTKDTNAPSGYGTATPKTNTGQTITVNLGIDTTLPITVIKSENNGLIDSNKVSLRNDASIERNLVRDRVPLEYENIREDDAVYRVRIWREIDAREKMNLPFRYAAKEDNGGQRFISIILKAIKEDNITAFSSDDDRFTTPITPDAAINAFGGGLDTSRTLDLQGNLTGYQVRPKPVDADSIYKFRLKEEWVFDKESSRMFVRILGIAPIFLQKNSLGDVLGERTAFWVYYPDLRPILAKAEVYNGKNYGARMTWEELFETRLFSSYIVKSSIDNPYDKNLKDYIKDPLFRLLEGENIKDKIFNYEQALWSY